MMLKNFKLLVIDDEDEILENLYYDLKKLIPEIVTINDPLEALKEIQEGQDYTCIISDIKMPKLNGIDLVKKIRKLKPEIPIIFLSAHGDENHMKKALELNVFNFINKPYDLWELKENLIDIYGQKNNIENTSLEFE